MKKTLLLTSIATFTMLFQACEKQEWKETKMFHDVPKRVSDEKAPAKATEAHPAESKPAQ
jgi:hypothetical protein